jgi:hypothetical protein
VSFLAAFIMRGRMYAIMVASSLALVSLMMHPLFKFFIIIVSFATIALVTLRKGALEGLYVLLYATAAAAILGALLLGGYAFLVFIGISCLTMWLPVWLVAVVLREGRQLSLTIDCAVFIAVFGVMGFYLYASDPAKIWQTAFAPFLQILLENTPAENTQDMQNWVNWMNTVLSHYMTGIFAASTLFTVLSGLFLGRWWQAVLYNPGGFKQEFLSLRTGSRLSIASILVIIVAKAAPGVVSEIAWNVTILLFVLYLFIGTSVLHTLFAAMKQSTYLVPMFYITILLVPHLMLPVALVGLCDAWLNLRKIQPAIPPKG